MQDFVNLVMLVCASLASMGLGVLLAYAAFKAGFGLMRWHAGLQVADPKTQVQTQPQAQIARVS